MRRRGGKGRGWYRNLRRGEDHGHVSVLTWNGLVRLLSRNVVIFTSCPFISHASQQQYPYSICIVYTALYTVKADMEWSKSDDVGPVPFRDSSYTFLQSASSMPRSNIVTYRHWVGLSSYTLHRGDIKKETDVPYQEFDIIPISHHCEYWDSQAPLKSYSLQLKYSVHLYPIPSIPNYSHLQYSCSE